MARRVRVGSSAPRVKGRAFAAELDPRAKPGAPADPVGKANRVVSDDLVDSVVKDDLVVADVADNPVDLVVADNSVIKDDLVAAGAVDRTRDFMLESVA